MDKNKPKVLVAESGTKGAKPGKATAETSATWQALEARFVRVCGRAMERSSWAVCRRTGSLLGLSFFYGVRGRQQIAVNNLRRAFPGLSEHEARHIARRAAQNLGMTFCESLHMRGASRQDVLEYVDLIGAEHLRQAIEAGTGAVLLSAHFGNWELAGARVAQEFPLTVLARPNSNVGVERQVDAARRAVGMKVISKWETARPSLRVLRANEVLTLLPDQRAGKQEGIILPMFGHPTRFYSSVAQMALLTGAPIIPGFGIRRTPWLADGRIVATITSGFNVQVDEALPKSEARAARDAAIVEGTQRVIAELEDVIRQHPEQWWWLHRRWRGSDAAKAEKQAAQENRVAASHAAAEAGNVLAG